LAASSSLLCISCVGPARAGNFTMHLVWDSRRVNWNEKRVGGGETGLRVEWVGVGKESWRSATR
jgi:hypothetical protein